MKYWSNVTIPADMPSVGDVMAQMYEVSTGRTVDGVFVIDPAGIAGLMDVTGPVELPDIGQTHQRRQRPAVPHRSTSTSSPRTNAKTC